MLAKRSGYFLESSAIDLHIPQYRPILSICLMQGRERKSSATNSLSNTYFSRLGDPLPVQMLSLLITMSLSKANSALDLGGHPSTDFIFSMRRSNC